MGALLLGALNGDACKWSLIAREAIVAFLAANNQRALLFFCGEEELDAVDISLAEHKLTPRSCFGDPLFCSIDKHLSKVGACSL